VAGMFYWMESVQSYDEGGWRYIDELAKFVEGGMEGTSFIDSVSGIVNRGCHNPPCGTGAVDGGYERSQNFKKVLDTMFAGDPPEVSGSMSPSNLESSTKPSAIIPSSHSPLPPTQTTGDKWYPDYNPIWAKGTCSNSYPAPSGRPHYDSLSECCAKAYGGQVSGACVALLPSSPVESTSIPSSTIPDGSSFLGSLSIEEGTQPTNEVGQSGMKWYPDYNPIWALGVCSNTAPAPSGRPHYESQSECCKMAYGGQASGACVGYTTSTVSKLETYYPNYSGNWAEGTCINAYPAPSSRPQYNSQQDCCEKAYAGQSSGACINDIREPVAMESALDNFYPDYNPIWALGVCSNKAPLPQGRPTYSSQTECCEFAYRGQASGACVNHAPRDTPNNLVSFAESFTTEFMAPHAALRSNFVTYSCGESNTIPSNTAIMDILFDYEVLLPKAIQVKHALPSLKKEIMDGLAGTLKCQITHRRGLRKVLDGTLLGFQSVEGSDVIDGERGSCTVTQEKDGEICYPVIGHIAAVMKFDSTNDEVLAVKNNILNNIRHTMTGNSISSNSLGIKYINEHKIADIHTGAEVTTDSSNQSWVTVVSCFLAITVGITLTFFAIKRRRISRMVSASGTHDSDSPDESICIEKEFGVEETFCINSSLADESSHGESDEPGSGCSRASSDCDDSSSSSTRESVNRTSNHQCDQTQPRPQPGALDAYISKTRNNPSVFSFTSVNNSLQPSVENENECTREDISGDEGHSVLTEHLT